MRLNDLKWLSIAIAFGLLWGWVVSEITAALVNA
jgi:hypothetical protein